MTVKETREKLIIEKKELEKKLKQIQMMINEIDMEEQYKKKYGKAEKVDPTKSL